jgi:hypothetical protein
MSTFFLLGIALGLWALLSYKKRTSL